MIVLPTEAEAYFRGAWVVARRQQTKSWELRGAMSLAQFWRDQGKNVNGAGSRRQSFVRFANGAPNYIDVPLGRSRRTQCEGARSHLMRHGVLWSKPQERRSARTTGNPDMLRAFAV